MVALSVSLTGLCHSIGRPAKGALMDARPRRSSLGEAFARAIHQVKDSPRVFSDPLAVRLLGATPERLVSAIIDDPESPQMFRLFVAMRHRFAEDAIAAAVAGGTRQVVILGGGLDTFGCRNPYQDVTVFDVDDSFTQGRKRRLLTRADIPIPPTLRFADVDSQNRQLASALEQVGFDRNAPTFFMWLGRAPMASRDTINTTLRYVAGQNAPCHVVFDYHEPPELMPTDRRDPLDRVMQYLDGISEPWVSFFTEDAITTKLRAMGFAYVEDLDWQELLGRYVKRLEARDLFGGHIIRAVR